MMMIIIMIMRIETFLHRVCFGGAPINVHYTDSTPIVVPPQAIYLPDGVQLPDFLPRILFGIFIYKNYLFIYTGLHQTLSNVQSHCQRLLK